MYFKNPDYSFLEKLNRIQHGGDGAFETGKGGVLGIFTPDDKKVEFIEYENTVLCYIKSSFGQPAIYPVKTAVFEPKAKSVLMDLDGTSVHSEKFWMWIIEQTISRLMGYPGFQLEDADEPFVSGHSVSEHLQYCIEKYCPDKDINVARKFYFEKTEFEMNEILNGRGRTEAFTPAPGLKEFLLELKGNNIKIGLVTSGLYNKAMPEILSAFKTLNMGDPLDFYDSIVTSGYTIKKGQTGTLGELSSKPHPWLYSETARVGLGMAQEDTKIIGIEDSSAGVISIRLAGYSVIGINGGNIKKSNLSPLCLKEYDNLCDSLNLILNN